MYRCADVPILSYNGWHGLVTSDESIMYSHKVEVHLSFLDVEETVWNFSTNAYLINRLFTCVPRHLSVVPQVLKQSG